MTISRWIHHKKNPCQVPEAKPHTDLQTRCFRAGGEGRGSRKSNGGMSSTLQVVCREAKSSVRRVGLLYDDRMRKHRTPDGDHPENPDRIDVIWDKLLSNKIPQRCEVLTAKEAEDKHLLTVHSGDHVNLIRNISSIKFDSRREYIASKWNSIYLNEGSSEAAYLAAGSVIEVAERVAKGELKSAAAIVRPPGHHAEHDEAMGFCLFNNVAVATSVLLNLKPELGIEKILIVDWDVHHGNGTQKMFWKDPRVLFFSVHRHEFGKFYPGNDDGFYTMVGGGPGAGFNINVPWENGGCGDADYFAVWDHILIPVAKEFEPDMIIVSAGFDAAVGDPLGGCHVTPYGYSMMLKKLMDFAQGKIVLALEGGYNLASIANSFLGCMKVLLEDKCCKIGRKKNSNKNRDITELQDYSVHRFVTRSMTKDPNNKPISGSSEAYPFESSWLVIKEVRKELSAYWPILALPLDDSKRRELSFNIGDAVFLRLQPYRQRSLAKQMYEKLSPRFYGPYKVVCPVGTVAYELELPADSEVHPIFHVSSLRPAYGYTLSSPPAHLPINTEWELVLTPAKILGHRWVREGGLPSLELLVQWVDRSLEKPSWESYDLLAGQFPDFYLEDKTSFHHVGCNDKKLPLRTFFRKRPRGDCEKLSPAGDGGCNDKKLPLRTYFRKRPRGDCEKLSPAGDGGCNDKKPPLRIYFRKRRRGDCEKLSTNSPAA